MLRDAAVDILMKRLGNQQNPALRQDIINEMVIAQETVLEGDIFHPWFLVSEEASNSTIVGDERVLLPDNFIALWEEAGLYRYDANLDDPYVEMDREDWSLIKKELNYSDTPTHWDIGGVYLLMRPLADAVYPLRFWYIGREPSLAGTYGATAGTDGNIENNWLKYAADWLLGETGIVIGEQYLTYKPERVKTFRDQVARGRNRLMSLNVEMEEALKRRVMGE
jgi:hypothetical protein